jgi:Lantibiotic dehydratase, N terminus
MLSGYVVVRRAGWPLSRLRALAVDFTPALERREKFQQALLDAKKVLLAALDEALEQMSPSAERTVIYNVRKLVFQGKKTTSQSIVTLQGTNLSVLFEQMWLCELECQQADQEFEAFYYEAWMENRQTLHNWTQDETIQRTLLFTSHDLLQQLSRCKPPSAERWDKNERSAIFSLLRYGCKMATQTSPLSRFASVNIQTFSAQTNYDDEPELGRENIKITPNVALLPHFYAVLRGSSSFVQAQKCRVNPSLWLTDEQVFWCFTKDQEEQLQQANCTPLLVHLAEKGQQSLDFNHLCAEIQSLTAADLLEVQQYLLKLFEVGVLEWIWPVDGYSPGWCGQLYQYLGFLAEGSQDERVVQTAFLQQWLRTAARTIPYQSVDEARQTQVEAFEQVRLFFERYDYQMPPELRAETLFYEDMAHSECYTFDEAAIVNAVAAVKSQMESRPIPVSEVYGRLWTLAHAHENGISLTETVAELTQGEFDAISSVSPQPTHGGWVLRPSADHNWRVHHFYPGTGKLAARWLHLFPARYTTHYQERAAAYYAFPVHAPFNANFQPPLGKACLSANSRFQQGELVQNWRIKAGQDGALNVLDANGQQIVMHDLGLEAQEAKSLSAQLLFAAAVSPQHIGELKQESVVELPTNYFINPVRLNRTQEWLWLREKLMNIGLNCPFFITTDQHAAQYIDPNSPMLIQLLLQILQQADAGMCQVWAAEFGPFDHAIELVVEYP